MPDGRVCFLRPHINQTLVEALAPTLRWRLMLETDPVATVREIAAAEKNNESSHLRNSTDKMNFAGNA